MKPGTLLKVFLIIFPISIFCYLYFSGTAKGKIVILWGAYTEEFEGLPVEIDGKIAGKLEKYGSNPRTAFPVSKGEHQVRLIHPRLECPPVTVKVGAAGIDSTLMPEIGESVDAKGVSKAIISFRM